MIVCRKVVTVFIPGGFMISTVNKLEYQRYSGKQGFNIDMKEILVFICYFRKYP